MSHLMDLGAPATVRPGGRRGERCPGPVAVELDERLANVPLRFAHGRARGTPRRGGGAELRAFTAARHGNSDAGGEDDHGSCLWSLRYAAQRGNRGPGRIRRLFFLHIRGCSRVKLNGPKFAAPWTAQFHLHPEPGCPSGAAKRAHRLVLRLFSGIRYYT